VHKHKLGDLKFVIVGHSGYIYLALVLGKEKKPQDSAVFLVKI
jgi:hypothetical protein|tara:strand:- start:710 stop:838 length:129 start_codon:yes stop_codon:yes gene_type:complete